MNGLDLLRLAVESSFAAENFWQHAEQEEIAARAQYAPTHEDRERIMAELDSLDCAQITNLHVRLCRQHKVPPGDARPLTSRTPRKLS